MRGPGARVGCDSGTGALRGGRLGPSDACSPFACVLPSPRRTGPLSPRGSSGADVRQRPLEPSHGARRGPERLIARPFCLRVSVDGPARVGRALSSEGTGQARGPAHPRGNGTTKGEEKQKAAGRRVVSPLWAATCLGPGKRRGVRGGSGRGRGSSHVLLLSSENQAERRDLAPAADGQKCLRTPPRGTAWPRPRRAADGPEPPRAARWPQEAAPRGLDPRLSAWAEASAPLVYWGRPRAL